MHYVALILKTLAISMLVIKVPQKHGYILISGFEQHMKQGHVHMSYHRY